MIKLPVLEKNDNWFTHKSKLLEEVKEVIEELDRKPHSAKEKLKYDLAAVSEVFDVIEVCIGILDKLENEGIDIEKAAWQHYRKLESRGRKSKGMIEIEKLRF